MYCSVIKRCIGVSRCNKCDDPHGTLVFCVCFVHHLNHAILSFHSLKVEVGAEFPFGSNVRPRGNPEFRDACPQQATQGVTVGR